MWGPYPVGPPEHGPVNYGSEKWLRRQVPYDFRHKYEFWLHGHDSVTFMFGRELLVVVLIQLVLDSMSGSVQTLTFPFDNY